MVWIDSCPHLQVPLSLHDEEIVSSIYVPNSPVLVVLTHSSVHLFNKTTFLPLGVHERSADSIETTGSNVKVKTKYIDSSNIVSQFKNFNLFVLTDLNYLVIYSIQVDYEQAIYDIHSATDDQLIQSAQPLITRTYKFSISGFIKSATNLIINSNMLIMPNLINQESVNNAGIIDNALTQHIELVKSLKIFKTVKLEESCDDFWVLTDTHDLLAFNSGVSWTLQAISILSSNSHFLEFSDQEWYEYSWSSEVIHFAYNRYADYCVFLNSLGELWCYNINENTGFNLLKGFTDKILEIIFNPKIDLFLIQTTSSIKLYKLDRKFEKLEFLKDVKSTTNRHKLNWSSNGEFFAALNETSGFWSLYSKFGRQSFASKQGIQLGFLRAKSVLISENSTLLYVISHDSTQMSCLKLLNSSGGVYYNAEYMSVITNKTFNKFPLLIHFKNAMNKSTRDLKISKNSSNQLSISISNCLAISTPILSDGTNHVLWFNYNDHSSEKRRIINHFWFNDFLVVINRNHVSESDDTGSIEKKVPIYDEVLILNTKNSKYGLGGKMFEFDNDSIMWNYNFSKSLFLNVEMVQSGPTSANLLIVTNDLKLIILEISSSKSKESESGSIGVIKNYDIYIQLLKVIHLDSINTKLEIKNIVQTTMAFKKHFIFLLNTGELYLLKNTSVTESKTNYNLSLIHKLVGSFSLISICGDSYLYFQSSQGDLVIHKLSELVEETLQPIKIPIDEEYQFLELTDSLESIFLETVISDNSFLTTKLSKQLILHKFIEYYLVHDVSKVQNFKSFKHYNYSLELLLFNYLTENNESQLTKLIEVISDKSIFINCFRKIEVKYWKNFFRLLDTTPLKFMDDLIVSGNVELCYHYLIIYLNSKTDESGDENSALLTTHDHELILSIIAMLETAKKWEWCFELCRFVKILEPKGVFLQQIQEKLEEGTL